MAKTKPAVPAVPQNFKTIPVGTTHAAIVSPEDYEWLSNYTWHPVQAHFGTYAKAHYTTKGKRRSISMHRIVNQTRFGFVCHHKNGRTLDNRRENLVEMSKIDHKLHHMNNNVMKRFIPLERPAIKS